jgi:hypothetical protein
MATIKNKQIDRVCVIDDDEASRYAMGLTVEDSKLIAVPQNQKIDNLDAYFNEIVKPSDAIVSDHHLRKKNYFPVNGAEVVSRSYDKRIPSVLVTKYEQAVIDEIRKYRQKIPIILNPDEFDPDSLMQSLEFCINEFNGEIVPSRKVWRTLIRVDDIGDNHLYLIIPSWNSNETIKIPIKDLPVDIQSKAKADVRMHAKVNVGATLSNDLFFLDWEIN